MERPKSSFTKMNVMFLGFKNNLSFLLFALLFYAMLARDGGLALASAVLLAFLVVAAK